MLYRAERQQLEDIQFLLEMILQLDSIVGKDNAFTRACTSVRAKCKKLVCEISECDPKEYLELIEEEIEEEND